MTKGKYRANVPASRGPQTALGILELERFSQESLVRWKAFSQDLDELQALLYFGLLPEQRRLNQALVETLHQQSGTPLSISQWARIVSYQYSMEPLSAAGSLHSYGGRFNAGVDLDPGTLDPWPALYIAEDQETAFREKFQIPSTSTVDGLSAQELALAPRVSHTTVFLDGELRNVFDMMLPASLNAVARVLGKIKMPPQARSLKQKLRIPNKAIGMINTGQQLHTTVLAHNWRVLPVQFGLPAPSHTLAALIRSAGFEAILYRSTKGAGRCVAVFPEKLFSGSFIQIADVSPPGTCARLDLASGDYLAGWDTLPAQRRPR